MIFWRKWLCSLSVERVYKLVPHLWSRFVCVTTLEEVKGLHMIISLDAMASCTMAGLPH